MTWGSREQLWKLVQCGTYGVIKPLTMGLLSKNPEIVQVSLDSLNSLLASGVPQDAQKAAGTHQSDRLDHKENENDDDLALNLVASLVRDCDGVERLMGTNRRHISFTSRPH